MCCQETETLGLPAEVIEALAHYRRLLDERGWDWGDEQLPDFFRWARFSMLGPLFEGGACSALHLPQRRRSRHDDPKSRRGRA